MLRNVLPEFDKIGVKSFIFFYKSSQIKKKLKREVEASDKLYVMHQNSGGLIRKYDRRAERGAEIFRESFLNFTTFIEKVNLRIYTSVIKSREHIIPDAALLWRM